jgi:hypothetical protein
MQMQSMHCENPSISREEESFHNVVDTLAGMKNLNQKLPSYNKRQIKKKITVASKKSLVQKLPSHIKRQTTKKVTIALKTSFNQKLPSLTKCQTTKKVTFASKECLASVRYGPCCSDLSECEKKRLWWRGEELYLIREQAHTLIQNLHETLDENDIEHSYICIMERMFNQGGVLSKDDELLLWIWVSKAHSRRGLEKFIAPRAGRHRRMRVRSSIRKVLEFQKLLGELNINASLKSEMLAVLTKSYTGPEQVIAEVFGKADEVAATQQQLYPL